MFYLISFVLTAPLFQPYQHCERGVGGVEKFKNVLQEHGAKKNDPIKGSNFQVVRSGGKKKIVLKPGSQFTLDILNQVVQMFNEVIDERRMERELTKETEDNEDMENEETPVGPIIMQMETNVSLVEDIFTQNSESEEDETEIEENLDEEDGEENGYTDQSDKQRFGRRLLSISEGDMVDEEVENNEEDSSKKAEEKTSEVDITIDDVKKEAKEAQGEAVESKEDAAKAQNIDSKSEMFHQDDDIVKAEACHLNNAGCQSELEVTPDQEEQTKTLNDHTSGRVETEDIEKEKDEVINEEEEYEDEEEEEDEEDDFDLLDEDTLSEMLSDYDEPLMKVEVFMELVDTLEEKLKVKDNKELHISALQSLVVYILTAEELATEDFAIASSSPTKAASLFTSLSSRLDQLKQTYLPQAVAFDHYVGEAWKEFVVMLDDVRLADMRRAEMQKMINRWLSLFIIQPLHSGSSKNAENLTRFVFNFHYAAELGKVIKARGLEEELSLIEEGRQEVEEMRLLYDK